MPSTLPTKCSCSSAPTPDSPVSPSAPRCYVEDGTAPPETRISQLSPSRAAAVDKMVALAARLAPTPGAARDVVRPLASILPTLVAAAKGSIADIGELLTAGHLQERSAYPTVHPVAAAGVAHLRRLHEESAPLAALLKPRGSEGGSLGAAMSEWMASPAGMEKRLFAATTRVVSSVLENLESIAAEVRSWSCACTAACTWLCGASAIGEAGASAICPPGVFGDC